MPDNLCAGSGQRPTEMVILDTDWGDPPGTCQVCGRSLPLDFYRLPDHPAREQGKSS